MKLSAIAIVGVLLIASPLPMRAPDALAAAEASSKMPPDWDARIPLPKGATLVSSTQPNKGVVYSAEFTAPGDYKELVDFYEKEIPKAGFTLGPKVAVPARKVYNRSFMKEKVLDSVVIAPSPSDPSKFSIHITYTPLGKKS
jgi:hypothetical protein